MQMSGQVQVKRGRGRPPKSTNNRTNNKNNKTPALHSLGKRQLRKWWHLKNSPKKPSSDRVTILQARNNYDQLVVVTGVEPYECPICLQLMIHPISLSCGHAFCLQCIEQVEDAHSRSCPHCRADIYDSYHELDPSLDQLVRYVYASFLGEEEQEAYNERALRFQNKMEGRGCKGQELGVGLQVKVKNHDCWMKGVVTQVRQSIIEVTLKSRSQKCILRADSFNLQMMKESNRRPLTALQLQPFVPEQPVIEVEQLHQEERMPIEAFLADEIDDFLMDHSGMLELPILPEVEAGNMEMEVSPLEQPFWRPQAGRSPLSAIHVEDD